MKKIKRILALAGVILLLALYVITFITAFLDNADTMAMFKASVLATILIPVLIWAYSFVYRLTRTDMPEFPEEEADREKGSGQDSPKASGQNSPKASGR